ncbi:MAG TPA: ABC transporter permease [Micromonosporaceae bacterium]
MAFEDSAQTSGAGSRYLGEGFRQEPDFREATTTFHVPGPPPPAMIETTGALPVVRRTRTPNLDHVFDDPTEGEPGRDRMVVHGLWELILLVAAGGVGYLLLREDAGVFSGEALKDLLLGAAVLGLLAVGAATSLRAGAPNLSLGAVAVAASLYFGQHAGNGVLGALLVVVGVCAAIGAVQGLVVVGLQVPGWAAGLGVALVMFVWSNRQAEVSMDTGYDPLPHTFWWVGGFVAASVIAGLVGMTPSVRRGLGRYRPVADPALRRGFVAAFITLAATVVSSIFAGLAGVLSVSVARSATPSDGFVLTGLAIGAALLGGTSAFGRRGGIFGTVFAVGLVTLVIKYAEVTERSWQLAAFAGVAVGLGLLVTRLVERLGRPAAADPDDDDDEDWVPRWNSGAPKPVNPGAGPGGIWASDESWGSSEGR